MALAMKANAMTYRLAIELLPEVFIRHSAEDQ
jgi:hypothetical protein